MENVTTTIQDKEPLIFTDSAAEKVKKLIEEEKNPSLNLRVFITGGGCSGFQYGFTFDERSKMVMLKLQNVGSSFLLIQ